MRESEAKRTAVSVMRVMCASTVLLACGQPQRVDPPPLVVLVSLDTTRVDHLGCYGYRRATSPNIDALANDSVLYEDAIANGTWTLPSHASLFTGKAVSAHGAQYDQDGPLWLTQAIEGPAEWETLRARTISRSEATLAERLRQAGYRTGAVVGGPWLKRVFRLDQGFDDYDDDNITSYNGRPAADVTDRALAWIESTEGPRFLFLNYFDPHGPFEPPAEFARRLPPTSSSEAAKTIGLYDAEILYMDHHLGRFLDGLRAGGLYDDALIVVTADHGELLGEHGTGGHGDVPYQEVVRIPLLVKEPGSEGGRQTERIQLTDLFGLVLDRVGLPSEERSDLVVVESRTNPVQHRNGDWLAVFEGDLKLIWNSRGKHKLFDLRVDPHEQFNIVEGRADQAASMADRMSGYLASLPAPRDDEDAEDIDDETRESLRSLGYVD